jgi:propanol-preferring alcohol dehydrogenase
MKTSTTDKLFTPIQVGPMELKHRVVMGPLVGGLARRGKLIVVGVSDEPIEVNLIQLLLGTKSIITEVAGTPIDKEDTLRFSALQDVRPMLERMPLEKAPAAYARMMRNEARFRMVLTMESNREL